MTAVDPYAFSQTKESNANESPRGVMAGVAKLIADLGGASPPLDDGLAWLAGLTFDDEATFKAAVNLEADVDFVAKSGGTFTGALSIPTVTLTNAAAAIVSNTSDASDTKRVSIGGGGAIAVSRGAYADFYGNEAASLAGHALIAAGDVSGSQIQFYAGSTLLGFFDRNGAKLQLDLTTFDVNATTTDFSGAVTVNGTFAISNGAVVSGTYTPTATGVANCDSVTAALCTYVRIGSIVIVYGSVTVDPTAGATRTDVRISLPVASNLASFTQLSGTVSWENAAANGEVWGDTTNDAANLRFTSAGTSSDIIYFSFSYLIV